MPSMNQPESDQQRAAADNHRSPCCDHGSAHGQSGADASCVNTSANTATVAANVNGNGSAAKTGRAYWRSLDELADTPEFREAVFREFPASATEMLNSADRRQFLKIMGASMALAGIGLTGCRRWPERYLAPYAHRPAGHAPGSTDQFATCMELGGVASGLLVTSYDYRPTKIEGNPEHPINRGATDLHSQAAILDLYDPDRSQFPLHQGERSTWQAFTQWASSHFSGLKNARGNGLAILSEATDSPSVQAMRRRLMQAFPNAKWYEYEPIANDNVINGSRLAFGQPHRTHYAFDQARVVVSLESDFLHCEPAAVKWTRDFAQARRAEDRKTMNRLYAFEAAVSLTGANADHRVPMRSADVAVIAARLAAALVPTSAEVMQRLASKSITATVSAEDVDKTLQAIIRDLSQYRGQSIVIAGPRQPAEVHLLVHMINEALGNVGKTVFYTRLDEATPHLESIRALASDMQSGNVQTLVMIGGNPVYNAPADLDFPSLLRNVPTTLHLSYYVDETSGFSANGESGGRSSITWHINRAHFLEAWGDGRAYDGTVSIAQPLIEPLFDGKTAIELLAVIAGDEMTAGYDIVRRTFREMGFGDDEVTWRKALHDGMVPDSQAQVVTPQRVVAQNLPQAAQALEQRWAAPQGDELEAVFVQDYSVLDGRFANNGWLQELPDPITKLTWDNAVLISPATAAQRKLNTGDMVTVQCNGRSVDAAVMVLPGQHVGSITLALGYGRQFNGRISQGAGFNFYRLRSSDAMWSAKATMAKAKGTYVLATTQDHFPIDSIAQRAPGGVQDRLPTLFREATLEEYQEHPDFARHRTHVVHRLSLWEEDFPFQSNAGRPGARYAWAMSIDLNACTGCNACVIACQAENNIPIVGKDQVKRSREMHWLRVDRYFKGLNEVNPTAYMFAPILCMHCENAPCEQVCPVAATVHDEDGLNVMVYNRCVGTRYCANNCPYKVRRFNYFDYHRRLPHREQPGTLLQVEPEYYGKRQGGADPLRQMQFNPEVTVRMRGIMEKCTFCVQRIAAARIQAKNKWVQTPVDQRSERVAPIPDGTLTTACAQVCPAQAIVFGDLEDPNSRVRQLHKHERTYQMLEELNTKPRTRYMAKLRNPAFGQSNSGNGTTSGGHSNSEARSHG